MAVTNDIGDVNMNYDILTIALVLYYFVMFVFAILYLNDLRCYLLGLGHIKFWGCKNA